MNKFAILAIMIILACGAPVTLATQIPSTPSAIGTLTPERQPVTTTPTPLVRHVTGCWNLRQTAGGVDIGETCEEDVIVFSVSGDWVETPGGWICLRAFGEAAAKCEVQ